MFGREEAKKWVEEQEKRMVFDVMLSALARMYRQNDTSGGLMTMKKVIFLLAAMMVMISSTCLANSYRLVEAEYSVQAGDSLDSIAEAYMAKNTYGPREIREFKSGIVQLNDWLLTRDVQAGDTVKVNYWVSEAE